MVLSYRGVAGFHGIADDQKGRGGEGVEMYGNTGFAACSEAISGWTRRVGFH